MNKIRISQNLERIWKTGNDLLLGERGLADVLDFVLISSTEMRKQFDIAANELHYAGSCQRVGRCMRLAVTLDGEWVGGIVLGSTFPNILVRDEAMGLRKFVTDYKERGLSNPWSGKNRLYWDNLQKVVNHARTYIFPKYQGRGIGTRAHAELLTKGVKIWERKYNDEVYAMDTLSNEGESKLFLKNGWEFVGKTKGFTSDRSKVLSNAIGVKEDPESGIVNNIGLSKVGIRWWVWVIQFKEFN